VLAVNTSHQLDLFPGGGIIPPAAGKPKPSGDVIFTRPDPRELFVCGVRLDDYLTDMGLGEALAIRELLQKQNWEPFEARNKPGGRAPYAPEAVLGLILYGVLTGISSLRGLEALARRDLGCLWITGGLCPDHASIGRIIQRHEESLTGAFVTALTGTVLTVTGTGVVTVAEDGTVVQAAASNDHTIKREAARAAAQGEPAPPVLTARAECAEKVTATLEQRTSARHAKGKSADSLSMSPVEPEAVVQPQKNKNRGSSRRAFRAAAAY